MERKIDQNYLILQIQNVKTIINLWHLGVILRKERYKCYDDLEFYLVSMQFNITSRNTISQKQNRKYLLHTNNTLLN